jgi:hypothetical protein
MLNSPLFNRGTFFKKTGRPMSLMPAGGLDDEISSPVRAYNWASPVLLPKPFLFLFLKTLNAPYLDTQLSEILLCARQDKLFSGSIADP